MIRKLKIQVLGNFNFWVTVILSAFCVIVSVFGFQKYKILRNTTQDYIACETTAHQLQEGSDNLTKQVRLAAATGKQKYIDAYFEEAIIKRSRENALNNLSALRENSSAIASLQNALSASVKLMQTEYYSMRLVEEAIHADTSLWPKSVRDVVLSPEDVALSDADKLSRAQKMLIDLEYQNAKDEISKNVNAALLTLTDENIERQQKTADTFAHMFWAIIACVVVFAAIMILDYVILHRGVVHPLLEYNDSIRYGPIAHIYGLEELQTLAKTYNKIYEENKKRRITMKHQAEYDSLTELLNRRSFNRILNRYEKEQSQYALIVADVDKFKALTIFAVMKQATVLYAE